LGILFSVSHIFYLVDTLFFYKYILIAKDFYHNLYSDWKNLTTQTCNSYTKELTDSIKIIVGISISMTIINIFSENGNILNHSDEIILSIAGINSLVTFCITSGMINLQCSNN